MKVSKRMTSICDLVVDGEQIIDIGCDHGLVDIYLTISKNCSCTLYDVNSYIVNRAISNIKKCNLIDSIKAYVGNGFDDLKLDYDSTMILSGMGTNTILKILENNKTKSIICQSNTDLYTLRKNICELGYYISDENLVFDNNRYYVSIRFEAGIRKYSFEEYLIGPDILEKKDVLFESYIKKVYNKIYKDSLDSFSLECINCLKKYI